MEALKNAFDFSDQPRLDLAVAGAVVVLLLIFLIPLKSYLKEWLAWRAWT